MDQILIFSVDKFDYSIIKYIFLDKNQRFVLWNLLFYAFLEHGLLFSYAFWIIVLLVLAGLEHCITHFYSMFNQCTSFRHALDLKRISAPTRPHFKRENCNISKI